MMRLLIKILILLILLPVMAGKAAANEENILDVSESGFAVGEELIFELRVDRYTLGEVWGVKSEQGIKFGLSNLSSALDFLISVDLEAQRASGWYFSEDRTFSLNLSGITPQVEFDNKLELLNTSDFDVNIDDIYIEHKLLEKWFGIQFEIDYKRLILTLESDTKLAFLAKIEREENNKSVGQRIGEATLAEKKNDYKMLTKPVLDLTANTRQINSQTNTSFSALASHDLAYHNVQYYVLGDQDDLFKNARIRFDKESEGTDLLNGFASSYQFGDIIPLNTSTNNSSELGVGFALSSEPSANRVSFESVSINGDVQPGWDVELYRNDILIDTLVSLSEGRYSFENVELLYGQNTFKVVMYGPQGQIRTKEETYFLNSDSFNAGTYKFSVVNVGDSVFGLNNSNSNGTLLTTSYNLGLGSLPINLSYSQLTGSEDEDYKRAAIGTQHNLFSSVLVGGTVGVNEEGDVGLTFNSTGKIGNQLFNYRVRSNRGVNDELAHSLTLTGDLFSFFGADLSHQTSFSSREFQDDRSLLASNNLSFAFDTFTLSSQLNWARNEIGDTETQVANGALYFHKYMDGVFHPSSIGLWH